MMVPHTNTAVHALASMSQKNARTSGRRMAQSSSTHQARTRSPNHRPAMLRVVLIKSKSWLVCAGKVVTPDLNVCASTQAGSAADWMLVGNRHVETAALVVLYTGTQRKKVGEVAMGVTQQLVSYWVKQKCVPQRRIVEVEQMTGISRDLLIDPRLAELLSKEV